MGLQMFGRKEQKSHSSRAIKRVIAVAAGKGGVGKSTVTVNLARALSERGAKVGILDTDIYGPSVRRMLPEDRAPVREGEFIIPAICDGISVVSMAYFCQEAEPTAVRAPIVNKIISQFIREVDWGGLDYLLIDFPPGTGDIQLTLGQIASLTCALMVTTPQELALMDVRKAAVVFNMVKVPVLGVIENLSYYYCSESKEKKSLFGSGGGARLSHELGVPLLGELPIDPHLGTCSDQGKSIFSEHSDSRVAEEFRSIAEKVELYITALQGGIGEYLENFDFSWGELAEV